MDEHKKTSGLWKQIAAAIVVALLAGGTSPWWWAEVKDIIGLSKKQSNLYGQSETNDEISGKYLMDKEQHRIIIITHQKGSEYRIEEPTSPWPWEGTAKLDGGRLTGEGRFRGSLATMRVDGIVRNDGSIVIDYKFIMKGDGNPAGNRVDHHVWFPE